MELAASSPALGKSIPKKQGCATGGDAIRTCTSVAPASRIIFERILSVVPRTSESSTTQTRLFLSTPSMGLNFSLTFCSRTFCVGSMKVRPT